MAMPARKGVLDEKSKLRTINDVAIAVAQSIELDVVLRTALDKVMEAFKVSSGGIYLVDFKTDRLVLKTFRGLTPGFVTEKSNIPPGSGCAGWAVDHNEVFSAFGRPEAGFICEDAERLMGIDCLVASPIATKRRVHGVIELFAPTSRRLSEDEAGLINIISDQIGIAVENARLYEESRENVLKLTELQEQLETANKRLRAHLTQEAHIAEILQKSLLPRHLPELAGAEIAARLVSATAAADVGGDFYDFIDFNDGRLAIIVGDVSGSGIEASTLTGTTKNTLRAFAFEDKDLASVISRTNQVIHSQTDPSKFVALFMGFLERGTGRLDYCTAGQPNPVIARADGTLVELESGSTALGVDKDARYRSFTFDMTELDTLLVFTDGLIEARRQNEFFGEESIKRKLLEKFNSPAQEIVDSILSAAREFSGDKLRDDVALVALRLRKIGQ